MSPTHPTSSCPQSSRAARHSRRWAAAACAALALLAGSSAAQQELFGVVGSQAGALLGGTVAPAGDINGDGTPDLLVGASSQGAGGVAYVLSGKGGATLRTWSGGVNFGDAFGAALANVGDVNKDGVPDVLIGEPGSDFAGNAAGRAFVYSGATGAVLFSYAPAGVNEFFGAAVTGLGDINADTWPDFAVAAPGVTFGQTGKVFVYSGKTGALITSFTATSAGTGYGNAIDDAGDVNGDGVHDLIIGEPYKFTGGLKGRIEVRSGASLATTLFAINAFTSDEDFGYAVSGAGDVNDDGFQDVIVGAYFANGAAGEARVFLGPSGAASWVFDGDSPSDHFGGAVDNAGDIDKDGHDDVIVGGYQSALSATLPGYVRVFSGRTGGVLYQTVNGPQGGGVFGVSVAGVGDVNGDGWADIAVGAQHHDGPAGADTGRASVFEVLQHATNVGFGGPGAAQLSMYGSPLDDFGQMDLALTGAKPNAPAWLIASGSTSFLTFKGGVLVPNVATGVIIPLATNGGGKITIPGILGGFGPVSIVIQYAIKDAAQPFGFAMSNAVAPFFLP